jgi:3-methyladenine DNA glycosylase AlkC
MGDLLKNLYSVDFVTALADELKKGHASFDAKNFRRSVFNKDWELLELKNRMHHITQMMHHHLPLEFEEQLRVMHRVAPKFSGLTATVFPNFVEKFGQQHYYLSLDALVYFTRFSTSEFAIRPFLKSNPETINVMYDWARDKNHHVRRLASEGCRPLLPWAMKLEQFIKDPQPILPILERLKTDPEDYVYRSVANNLNDISKHHPKLVLDLAGKWINRSETTDWVLKHALRTLLKKGDAAAMGLFGFNLTEGLNVKECYLEKTVLKIGESTSLHITFINQKATAKFRFEYAVSYLKKNGSYTTKVFRISEKELKKNQAEHFVRKIDFKDLSTRKHHRGVHYVTIKINGIEKNRLELLLK